MSSALGRFEAASPTVPPSIISPSPSPYPIISPSPSPYHLASSSPAHEEGVEKIIRVVDDTQVNLKVMHRQLSTQLKLDPNMIHLISTIDEALKSSISGVKAVILDYTFIHDSRTGATIARAIHEEKKKRNLSLTDEEIKKRFPLVIGYSSRQDHEATGIEFIAAGAIAFFQKPAQLKELITFLRD